jgi:MoaA/NifB/PqqE/SkfB family radical SAM enzyme
VERQGVKRGDTFDDQIECCRPTLFVMTGGDPIRRLDLETLIRYATGRGLRVSLSPSAKAA